MEIENAKKPKRKPRRIKRFPLRIIPIPTYPDVLEETGEIIRSGREDIANEYYKQLQDIMDEMQGRRDPKTPPTPPTPQPPSPPLQKAVCWYECDLLPETKCTYGNCKRTGVLWGDIAYCPLTIPDLHYSWPQNNLDLRDGMVCGGECNPTLTFSKEF